jgi:glycerol-3-phosphate acyltransferase PlsY
VPILSYTVTAIAAYLLGSIPTGFLVGKARGIDIRTVGSGNIGATNAFRILGKGPGIFVLLMDALKGFAACFWFCDLLLKIFNAPNADAETYRIVAGIFVVLGHNYTCWLKFKGGKGIATMAGVYLALATGAFGIALACFILTILVTRYVSVGSIVAAIALPFAVWFTRDNLVLRIVTIALCALAIYKHKANLQRLLNGTENRITFKKKEAQ